MDEDVKKYQVIELEATSNLAKSAEIIEREREIVQKIMMENNIEFVIEIVEEGNGDAWFLELMVPKEDADRVVALLDKQGGLGYYVDLEETLLVSKDNMELLNDADIPDNFEEYLSQTSEASNVEVDARKERIIKAFKREEKNEIENNYKNDFSDDAIENNDEFSDGINKPRKTIIDYLIYIILAIILIKIIGSML